MKFLLRKWVNLLKSKLWYLTGVSLKRKIKSKWFVVVNILLMIAIVGIFNIDSIIVAQKPKMAEYIPNMEENIAKCLEIDVDCINVKATTEEKLGFTGREEGIASKAVCLVEKVNL